MRTISGVALMQDAPPGGFSPAANHGTGFASGIHLANEKNGISTGPKPCPTASTSFFFLFLCSLYHYLYFIQSTHSTQCYSLCIPYNTLPFITLAPFALPIPWLSLICHLHLQLPKKTFFQLHSFSLSLSLFLSFFITSFSPFSTLPMWKYRPSSRSDSTSGASFDPPRRNWFGRSKKKSPFCKLLSLSLSFSLLSSLSLSLASSSFLFPVVFFFFPFLHSFLRFKCRSVPRTETIDCHTRYFLTLICLCLCLCLCLVWSLFAVLLAGLS